jgi:hypothetical protein
MKKFPLIIGLVTVLAVILGVFVFSKNTENPNPANYEYFWSTTCPHCANVAAFYDAWTKKDSIKIDKLEVSGNTANARKLIQRGNSCKLPQGELGAVPLLFTPDGKCIAGDTPIIDFYKSL